jgi:hypothetical protein
MNDFCVETAEGFRHSVTQHTYRWMAVERMNSGYLQNYFAALTYGYRFKIPHNFPGNILAAKSEKVLILNFLQKILFQILP